jgi:hypothetical protein
MPQKRKRKPLPKRPCPCCGSVLSEKTINRHASGTHVPTRITVTLASSGPQNHEDHDFSGSEDSDDHPVDTPRSRPSDAFDPTALDPDALDLDPLAWTEESQSDEKGEGLPSIIQETWSGCRSRVDEYQSDADEDDFDENGSQPMSDTDTDTFPESEFEWEASRMCNGLGMNDLIDEDLQHIISEFCELFISFVFTIYSFFTNMECFVVNR